MPYIGNITQDFNVSNAMLDTDSVTSIKIVDGTIEGADIAANLDLSDSQKIRFGAGNDLQIYHNGSHSYIDDAGTGNLYIRSSQLVLQNAAGDEDLAILTSNGAVKLYFDDSKKLETKSNGVTVTGEAKVTTDLVMNTVDNQRIYLGASNDLQIYHDGINSYVNDTGTGVLRITSNQVQVTNAAASEVLANFIENGAVELYHNNSKKFETSSSGGTLTGDFTVTGNIYGGNHITIQDSDGSSDMLKIGASEDLRIYHYNNNSYIRQHTDLPLIIGGTSTGQSLYLQPKDGENSAIFKPNAEVELYYDNSLKIETTSYGARVFGNFENHDNFITVKDSGKFTAGNSDDLQIYHDGSNSFIDNSIGGLFVRGNTIKLRDAAGNEDYIEAFQNGAVRLYYDNSLKFRTYTGGVIGDQNIWVGTDNYKLLVGGSADLEIFHDGSHSNIKNNTGNLRLQCDAFRLNSADNSENLIKANKDGAVELYHDGTARFQTLSNGCEVLGRLGVGDGTNPETSFQVTATAAGAQYPMLLKNRTNGNAAVGMRFIASGADLSDGDFASIEAGHGAVGSTNHEFRFKTCSGGTVAEKLRIQAGGGISFNGDSAAANALDDYEQGTYTPSLSSGVGGGNISYNSRSGRYTKVGNLVHFTFHMNIASVTLDNGNLKFGGLPFTVEANDSNKAGAAFMIISNGNMPEDCTFRCETNDTQILVISAAGDAVVANTTSLNDGNRQVALAGFYYTTA